MRFSLRLLSFVSTFDSELWALVHEYHRRCYFPSLPPFFSLPFFSPLRRLSPSVIFFSSIQENSTCGSSASYISVHRPINLQIFRLDVYFPHDYLQFFLQGDRVTVLPFASTRRVYICARNHSVHVWRSVAALSLSSNCRKLHSGGSVVKMKSRHVHRQKIEEGGRVKRDTGMHGHKKDLPPSSVC